jgi:nicotinamidase/pyrazinamidase
MGTVSKGFLPTCADAKEAWPGVCQSCVTTTFLNFAASALITGTTKTGLAGYLKERGISRVFVTGLATDFCVAWSALDARKAGFDVFVIEDACRGIDLNGSLASAWKEMAAAGIERTQSGEIV